MTNATPPTPDPGVFSRATPVRILLIEQASADPALISDFLSLGARLDLRLRRVSSLAGAVGLLEHESFDVILVDLELPDGSGPGVIERLREWAALTPIVVLTAREDPEAALTAVSLGAEDYLVRGLIGADSLLRVIRHSLERARASASMKESEDRYRSLFDDAPISLWEEDYSAVKERLAQLRAEGVEDLEWYLDEHADTLQELSGRVRIVDVNRATLVLFDADSKEELLGSLRTILRQDSLGKFREQICALWRGATVFETEMTNRTLLHREVTVSLRLAIPPKYRDSWSKVFVSITDVTARRRAEAALERSRREQLALKDQLLSHVSHELRTPLTAIHDFLAVLRDGIAGEINDQQAEFLEIALRNTQQLGRMIGELLEATRTLNGKLRVRLEPDSLPEIIHQAVESTRPRASRAGVEIVSELPEILPRVLCDAERIGQVLLNLLDNALRFTPAGGRITVRVEGDPSDDNYLRVAVSDTGVGMVPDELERVFEYLYQGTQAEHRSRQGLGLGLYISRALITQHGGRIWAESEPGAGSSFVFTLPTALGGPRIADVDARPVTVELARADA